MRPQQTKPELLCPAGSPESLWAAVNNGCDAVYLGGQLFSARSAAENFTGEELAQAIDLCHLRGVSVYMACNTLVKDGEWDALYKAVSEAYRAGADALIVQDMGVLRFIKAHFPGIPCHASTQMTAHSVNDALFLQDGGFARVVLARELSLPEIREIARLPIETEVFVHGALCVCYSGRCLMSSMLGGRSGNRGRCAQPCRQKYVLEKDGAALAEGYLLSPMDMMALPLLDEIQAAGVSALKIEGRMKSPGYVALSTRLYRQKLDGKPVSEADIEDLTQIFNRGGGFTQGYWKTTGGTDMMSPLTPKSSGTRVGTVRSYAGGRCVIALERPLAAGDGIEIWTKTEPHPGAGIQAAAEGGDIITVIIKGDTYSSRVEADCAERSRIPRPQLQVRRPEGPVSPKAKLLKMGAGRFQRQQSQIEKGMSIHPGDAVYKSYDKLLDDKVKQLARGNGDSAGTSPKLSVNATVLAEAGKPLRMTLTHGGITHQQTGPVVETAQHQPLSPERLLAQLGKTGDTPLAFRFDQNECLVGPDIFLPVSVVNQFRRDAVAAFCTKWTASFHRQAPMDIPAAPPVRLAANAPFALTALVRRREQLEAALSADITRIYVEPSPEIWDCWDGLTAKAREKGLSLYIALPRVDHHSQARAYYMDLTEDKGVEGFLVRTWGQLRTLSTLGSKVPLTLDGTALPIANRYALACFDELRVILSPELSWQEIVALGGGRDIEIDIYGRQAVMTTRQCPVGLWAYGRKGGQYCRGRSQAEGYALRDRLNLRFPVQTDCDACVAHIYNSKTLSMLPHMHMLAEGPVPWGRLSFLTESGEETLAVIRAFRQALAEAVCSPRGSAPKETKSAGATDAAYTYGHFFRGVE